MVVACFSPLSAEIDDLYVPALIDVGLLESSEPKEDVVPYYLRVRAERLAASRRSAELVNASDDRRAMLFGAATVRTGIQRR